jgi:hypothetical protein
MRKSVASVVTLSMLVSCAATSVLKPVNTAGTKGIDDSERASVWADNGTDYYAMIRKIDGKLPLSRLGFGYPYSAYLLPGTHKLSVRLIDVSSSRSSYYDFDLDVSVEKGHAYAIKLIHAKTSGGANVHTGTELVDMGIGKKCAYREIAPMYSGYTPVKLVCN